MDEHHADEALPFLEAIADRPGDALPRLIFADWLEERGYDREASWQRWSAATGIRPLRSGGGAVWRFVPQELWHLEGYYPSLLDAERALLHVTSNPPIAPAPSMLISRR